ncbi:MAG TPA: putative PEP-binding protein, partial [Myxococcota bacterium]
SELTETLYAISRDDAEQYLPKMLQDGLLPADPFAAIDVDALGKMIRVGQYLAGDAPNAFPASLSGPQALTANGMFVAAQAGLREVVVPASSSLQARLLDAKMQSSLAATAGVLVPSSNLRDTPTKLFDLLVSRGDAVKKGGTQKVPEGVTALEHVERLQKQVEAGAMSTAEALLSVPPNIVDQLSKPVVDPSSQVAALSKGIAASPGCGQGRVALSKEAAAEFAAANEPYVLIVNEVHADEVEATRKAAGLVSVRGGKTSHAAMIASNSEVPCVMEEKVQINLDNKTVGVGKSRVKEGDWITIDGTKGQILPGKVPLLNPTKSTAFASLMKWADEHRTLDVLANADTPQEAMTAFARGANGVGLVRSEHMFYEADRLLAFRAVILSDIGARPAEMSALEKAQTDDYTALFSAAGEKKVAVRLLDPPLYEFLPTKPGEIKELAHSLDVPAEKLAERISGAQEIDSMLGMRGVRLALTRPDIEAMQVRSLARAYVAATKQGTVAIAPLHIIVPQVSAASEMAAAKQRILAVVAEVEKESGSKIPVKLGSMIETPRAALDAAAIGASVDFFSYGTNDLTQGTLGYGRNVAAKFIPELIKSKALTADPTESLDDKGVVKLMRVAEMLGKDENPALYGGVCGGQAGDPASIDSVQAAGLKYISVSPGQVAKARLAAGQAAVKANAAPSTQGPGGLGLRSTFSGSAAELMHKLARSLSGIRSVPTDASQDSFVDLVELHLREATAAVRGLRRNNASPSELEPLMRVATEAREVLDTNRLARALAAEVASLRAEVQQFGGDKLPGVAAALTA